MEELKAQLAANVDQAQWEWLIPHVQRDAVVVVDRQLDLLDVGVAISEDHVTDVQRWIGEQQIYKPSPEQISDWNGDRDKQFNALIVQPFILVQET